ncbi:heme ABC transporter ATP-binding protein [Williamsia deligens]|uniref:Heme ABC transporter ATP-binding protein n=1 Tax=Williamsia deligens TaxID=321325 RepID=A0ABW3G385_9NOCA|nr:heme ABC transporter ATP-binding protein [Williamsia deligens]MCP2194744.1 iron complex transport system ATP-binding protein [Williamsia deligens]
MTAPLVVSSLTVSRGGTPVLSDVDLTVGAGELLCVVGPNGAGKSTLIAAMAGSLTVDSGTVALEGDDVTALSPVEQARRRAILPQDHVVGGAFTCREVVQMARYPWNRTDRNADDDDAVAEALARCDVEAFADRPFATLSGGERARVALARVLAQRTPVLILDEPTAAMDPHFAEAVMGIVSARRDDGCAVVAVVHDLGIAAAYSDSVAVLARGRLIAHGTPESTLTAALLSDVYGVPMTVATVDGQRVVVPVRTPRTSR